MEKDLLEQIIETEREIQEGLDCEKASVLQWLACVREEAEEELRARTEEAELMFSREVEKARNEDEENAAVLVKKAVDQVARLEQLDDALLRRIVLDHIGRILPVRT